MTSDTNSLDADLALANERFALVAKATHDVIWEWDLVNDTIWWNDNFYHQFGSISWETAADVEAADVETADVETAGINAWSSRIHPDDRDRILTAVQQKIKEGAPNWSAEYRFRRADGTYSPVHTQAYLSVRHGNTTRLIGSMTDVSNQHQLEREQALEGTGFGTWFFYPIDNIMHWDSSCRAMFGLSAGLSITTDVILSCVHAADRSAFFSAFQDALNPDKQAYFNIDYRIIHQQTGQLRWIHAQGKADFNQHHTAYRFAGIKKDITVEKEQQEALHSDSRRYQVAFDNASVGVAVLDPTATIQLVNRKFGDMVGYQPAELTGVHFSVISHPDELALNKQLIEQLRNRDIPSYVLDKRYIRKDGTIIWARLNSAIVWNPDGTPNCLISIIQDITAEVQARQELKETEESLRMAVDLAQLGTWRFSLIAEEWVVSERIKEWLGVQPDDPVSLEDLFQSVPDHDWFTQFISNANPAQPNLLDIEYELKNRRSGLDRIMHSRGQVLFDEKGTAYAIMGTTQEVTSQRRTEQELEQQVRTRTQDLQQATDRVNQQAEQLRLVTDSALTAISLYSIVRDEATGDVIDLRYELMNQMALRLTGRRSEELIGRTMHQVFPGIAASGLWLQYKALAESENGNSLRFQNHYVHEGYDIWYEVQGVREDGFIVLSFLDITELKQAQLKLEALNLDLRRSNENLQQFAYVASHDLQEPLRKIESFGNILKDQYADTLSETGVDLLGRMQSASTRMAILIKDLLAYSRLTSDQKIQRPVALDQVISWVMSDLDVAILESGATINRPPLPTVTGDESQLRQLFQNLLSNAIKFRRNGQPPVISIKVDQVTGDELPAVGRPARPVASYYRIQVSDNGIGFDEQYRSRIFQVFQRLHNRSQYAGTGIGLAIVQKVVDNHNGMILATSEPGEGATFSVYLPA
ncbi:PAS domain-containing protein [Spirosoma sp. KUDC1026]|uniref:PAS domain-containing protein n=1 Tax=Spirosoma sp. KUDC1026 TaxID=2745947 RepID=UPI00159B9838|nr:PAS domain-containing protein [Spirosoma sp. KUDC1026]QKZ15100.1 PAS domain-containing protein [Spirosoma sp. KUDC1026]